MTVLKLNGPLSVREVPYLGGPETTDAPFIGEVDVITEVLSTFPYGSHVTVAIADERFDGDVHADHGSVGFSEYTPGDPAEFFLKNPDGPDELYPYLSSISDRGHDIFERLSDLEGQTITLWVADEPINTLA